MNRGIKELEQQVRKEILGSSLFIKSTSGANPFFLVNRLFEWCVEQGHDIAYTNTDGKNIRCTITNSRTPHVFCKSVAKTWYEATYFSCLKARRNL